MRTCLATSLHSQRHLSHPASVSPTLVCIAKSSHSQRLLYHTLPLCLPHPMSHLQGQREGHSPPQRSHPVLRLAPQREVPEHARSVVLDLLRGLSQQGQQAVESPEGQQLVAILLAGQCELLEGLGARSLHVQRAVGVLQDCKQTWNGSGLQSRQGFEGSAASGPGHLHL